MAEMQKIQSPAEVAEAQKVMEGMKVLNTVKNNPFWVTGNIDPLRVENLKSLVNNTGPQTPGNVDYSMASFQTDNPNNTLENIHAFEDVALDDTADSTQESGKNAEKNEAPKEIDHLITHGNTLSSLARKFDTTIDSIMKLNSQITHPDKITAGDHLKIHVGDKSAHADSINKPSQGSNTTAPDIQQTHIPSDKPVANTQGTETASHEKPDTKPDAETVDHKPTSGSVAKDYQSAVHGKPKGDFGKLRWTHEHMIPEMEGPGQMLSEAKTQIEDMAKIRLEDFWVEIHDNTILIPGNKEPIVLQTVEKYANIRNGNGSIDVQLYGENNQKHILTAGTDGALLLDMKPLPRVGKNNPIQTSAVESNTPKYSNNSGAEWLQSMKEHPGEKSLTVEGDNNSKTETVASVPGIGGWDGPST